MLLRILGAALAAVLCSPLAVLGAPFTPATDSHVLERLPVRATDPIARELRALRAALSAEPQNAKIAEKLARRYFDLAMAEGDPRYIGYAEAALRPFSTGPLPAGLLPVRAMLRQYKHDFEGALKDLAQAVEADSTNVEVHAWRAAIFMVQARYREAKAACDALAPYASELFFTGCSAYVEGTTGKTKAAYTGLLAVLEKHPDAAAESKLWNLTRLADMARRLGDLGAAEKHYRQALKLGVTDNFLLAAFADFLLEQKRAAEVAELLKDWARSDTLLLRLAFAENALGAQTAASRIQALDDRFAEAALRGESLHLQEEARFRLHLKREPRLALKLAIENWKDQREPRDAAILLEAALAAGEAGAARPALDWLSSSGHEDPALHRSAAALRALLK
jgi:Tfp pilus assembly protein PilF